MTEAVLRFALSAAQALEEIHAHRLIHKDINGNNIIVDRRDLSPQLLLISAFPPELTQKRASRQS